MRVEIKVMVLLLNQLLHITQSFEEMDSTTAALVKEHAEGKYRMISSKKFL